jgi:hypothetical protein
MSPYDNHFARFYIVDDETEEYKIKDINLEKDKIKTLKTFFEKLENENYKIVQVAYGEK